jgi:uncharacterized protein
MLGCSPASSDCVLLDTNVLVSAFASRGICADLLRHILVEHDLITGETMLTELKRTLLKRIIVLPKVVAKPRRHLGLGLRDRDDEWTVASAVAGKADALVTGDRDILEMTVHL